MRSSWLALSMTLALGALLAGCSDKSADDTASDAAGADGGDGEEGTDGADGADGADAASEEVVVLANTGPDEVPLPPDVRVLVSSATIEAGTLPPDTAAWVRRS